MLQCLRTRLETRVSETRSRVRGVTEQGTNDANLFNVIARSNVYDHILGVAQFSWDVERVRQGDKCGLVCKQVSSQLGHYFDVR